MRVEQLSASQVAVLLSGEGLRIRFGSFNVRLQTNCTMFANSLLSRYARHELAADEIAELHVQLHWSRPFGRSIVFRLNGDAPFAPVQPDQALLLLERGIHWGIAAHANHLLILHAAIVEKNGSVILLPHLDPHDHTTGLCAALVVNGFRLVSPALGLLDPVSGLFSFLPGLLELQNSTLNELAKAYPSARTTLAVLQTDKAGRCAIMQSMTASLGKAEDAIAVRHIVVPQFDVQAKPDLDLLPSSDAFMLLAGHSVNYDMLGAAAFAALTRLIRTSRCSRLIYHDYPNALASLGRLVDES